MEEPLEYAIVRINKADNSVVGAGFLISEKHVMTCAHVIIYALNIPLDTQEKPAQEVNFVFPVINHKKSFKAKIVEWYPVTGNQTIKDIAVLEILEPVDKLPEQARPVSVLSTKNRNLWKNKFAALGFPQEVPRGEWARGEILKPVGGGLIQIEGTRETGGRIEPGFSGTAIWDENLNGIVGMAAKEDVKRPDSKVAFMIPTEILIEAWNDWSQICRDYAIRDILKILVKFEVDIEKNLDLKWAYYQSIPLNLSLNLKTEKIDSPQDLVRSLIKVEKSLDKQKALLAKFASLILLQFKKDQGLEETLNDFGKQLEEWIKIHSKKDKKTLLKDLEQQHSSRDKFENYLLICFVEETDKISVKSWFVEENRWTNLELNKSDSLWIKDCQNLKDEELGKLVENLKSQCISLSVNRRLDSIHYFLPLKLLENQELSLECLDLLPIYSDDPFDQPSCFYHNVAIRLNRSGLNLDKISHWKRKGESLKQAEIKTIFKETEYVDSKSLYKELYPEEVLGTNLINIISKDELKNIMLVFLHAGIPLAIWKRKKIENNAQKTVGDDWFREDCLNDLFQRIKKCRQEGADNESHIGHYLSLLWDDPRILTPDLKQMYKMP